MQAAGKVYIFYPSRGDRINLWNFADLHYGNRGCAYDRLIKDRDHILADENSFWVGGGDYADYIGMGDKRFDPRVLEGIGVADLDQLGHIQTQHIRDLFAPIKHKCLGLLFGNHEAKYMRTFQQFSLHQWLCTELGVPNLGYSALLDIVFTRGQCETPRLSRKPSGKTTSRTFRLYIHHGAGGAQTPGGKMNRLLKFMSDFHADIYMIGHVHDVIAKRRVTLAANSTCNEIIERQSIGIVTGSYLRTYTQDVTGYGEEKGYSPVPLGATYVEIHPATGELRASV
jgi:predicted phosphodiesterase